MVHALASRFDDPREGTSSEFHIDRAVGQGDGEFFPIEKEIRFIWHRRAGIREVYVAAVHRSVLKLVSVARMRLRPAVFVGAGNAQAH